MGKTAQSKFAGMLATMLRRSRTREASAHQPLVVWTAAPNGRSVQIVVVWDAWRHLDSNERAEVIRDAYSLDTSLPPDHVTVSLGLTPAEALSLGYLPYRIVPSLRRTDKVSAQAVREAMKTAGGVLARIGDEPQLRFATLEQAQEAYRTLLGAISLPIWTLVQESGPSDAA